VNNISPQMTRNRTVGFPPGHCIDFVDCENCAGSEDSADSCQVRVYPFFKKPYESLKKYRDFAEGPF